MASAQRAAFALFPRESSCSQQGASHTLRGLSLALPVPLVKVSSILVDDYGARFKKKELRKLDFLSMCPFSAVPLSTYLVSVQQIT